MDEEVGDAMREYDSVKELPWGGKKYVFGQVEVVVDLRHKPHTWTVQLPHSCDEWTIGSSLKRVKDFKGDMEAAYQFVRSADICNS